MPTRKRLTRAQRREVIERAATQVFAEHGYERAGIDEIARRSGVTPPVVYDHFASKQDLYRRLLERQRDDLVTFWAKRLPLPPGRAALDHFARRRSAVRAVPRPAGGRVAGVGVPPLWGKDPRVWLMSSESDRWGRVAVG